MGRDAYRMRHAGEGHPEVPQAAFLLRGLQDVHAALLRDEQLVPYYRQAHGRENIGDNPLGTGHAGIRPRQPDVHSPKEIDSRQRRGMMITL